MVRDEAKAAAIKYAINNARPEHEIYDLKIMVGESHILTHITYGDGEHAWESVDEWLLTTDGKDVGKAFTDEELEEVYNDIDVYNDTWMEVDLNDPS